MTDETLLRVETSLSGYELLNDPLLNKGTAFTEEERDEFDLHGLLPPHVSQFDDQVKRRYDAFRSLHTDIAKYTFLRGLQDTNEVLFYALLTRNIEEMMPIIYTPTVGLGCQRFSHIFRKPRGLFLSVPHKRHIRQILGHPRFDHVEAIVVSDGERILGLGDQGAGGMGIPIGKLSLYTACAGLHPATTLPIILDVGTDNEQHLADPLYIGWQHGRGRGPEYDDFVESFVDAVRRAAACTFALGGLRSVTPIGCFPDTGSIMHVQRRHSGTAAIAVGTLLSAINVTGVPLGATRGRTGAGSASGISAPVARAMIDAGLSEAEAHSRFISSIETDCWSMACLDCNRFKCRLPSSDRISNWKLETPTRIGLPM
jgi:malate dehydrogenase (oxaloacetate-decarboxylating)